MDAHPLNLLFNPRSVAVYGASVTSNSVGALTYANLREGGFKGRIFPVNPKHETLGEVPCYARTSDLPEEVDLAVIATPARVVPGILRDLGEEGIKHAIVLSAGFGEGAADKVQGKRLEAEAIAAARKYGIRFLGPNCVGLTRPWLGLNASFLRTQAPEGRLALVSQSGALLSAIADWAGPHHSGFSAMVSLGNSINIDFGDVVEFLATDPKTDAILLYVEGLRDAPGFLSAVRHAARMKPVIVVKSGRHAVSAEAAHTHTGALIGSDAVFDAAIERVGAVRADTLGQLFAAAEILANSKKASGKRLCIVTNGGGAGVLAADRAVDLGLELPPLSDKTKSALDQVLPPFWSHANPVDILGDASPEAYHAAVKAAMADPDNDGVLVLLTPQAMTDPTAVARAVIDALPKRRKKPVLACWMGESSVLEARKLLSENGVSDFQTPERAVEGFSYLAKHHRNRKLALEMPRALPPEAQPDYDGARMIIEGALSEGRKMLSDTESKALLRAFHVPVNITIEATDPRAALVAAETVGFPVAMKINSPDITHKTDVGGVKINIAHAASVKRAFHEIVANARRALPEAAIHGVTVEPMAQLRQTRELVIGASRDPVFGPTILFGAGGTMVEVMRDSAVALPPINSVVANRLINRTKVSKALDRFRDYAPVDRAAVVDVLKRVSKIVSELPEVLSLDINPLMAGPDGVLAVDARIEVARPPASDGIYDHLAIHPYPRHLMRQTYLTDGTPLMIRPIRTDDADHVQEFTRNLSEEARLMRFMGQVNELSPEMLVQFTQLDYRREMALVAMAELDGSEVQVGVARYVINPDGRTCEFAVVVSDRIQHQGLGTKLMKGLFHAASQHGLEVIEGSVLKKNEPMLRLMKELGFTQRPDPDDRELVIVERWI
ncbi:bifunctional acetate--CoA ligase family protein/GNAT family N-acetyltransferase [Aliiroseovarius crassostreae]|uniref:bifunctional acetate--CoA ligase family protein/GNAT family N-acetyltransferase n=1 Tax=Aliiroseovarius crassostreae TaxID=154981 RepID=UPI0022055D24|nr:bifunctional acetate--CoA ligase family protein/GNAT family N-acetyltransferase [Aliiroseovarius crassostreae]UWP89528.1 bifunctional acetate--CoA ligase family protein/GNAT family N-acetyltransferase [Aliiroseovarius crassostreae]UWP92666.1 bifunctional acetate--CoA ligase family protein/GNAT family N-acetyltransferase [Aliiroseovarius crassostreae]UWQ02172.1 bifunctional acetate--CoA ligase family protein/GNAT family N-acetyltransferase [Aliiroseovarius crassostreae]UWQ04106.1 bifunctional